MSLLEILVLLMLVNVAVAWLARRAHIPYPIALLLSGIVLGLLPGLPTFPLDPNLILVILLPPILYQAALFTSWRDFRFHLRAITLLAVGLVIATTLAVAVTARWLVPDLPWAVACALGAIVSPPDAVAATAILGRMKIPRTIVTILEGESLINDATGLVFYKFAVAAALTGSFSFGEAAGQFLLVAAGGLLLGVLAGWLYSAVHSRLQDPLIEIMLSLVLPYLVYLAAEHWHLSGVLAVVAAGLVHGRHDPQAFSPHSRIMARSVWEVHIFLLNSLVFVLIGLELSNLHQHLGVRQFGHLLVFALTISAVVIIVRLLWIYPNAYLPRLLRRRLGYREVLPPWQQVTVVGWCGMRGIVSLAAALALPLTTLSGEPFPGRELVIFTTFIVILVTLLLPGLTLAPLIRFLGVGADLTEAEEQRQARRQITSAALRAIRRVATANHYSLDLVVGVRAEYEACLLKTGKSAAQVANSIDPVRQLRLVATEAARGELIRLWRDGQISDNVLRTIERELDLEEVRLK
jgi:CPA1 family monovalent cation:H+ antiporter